MPRLSAPLRHLIEAYKAGSGEDPRDPDTYHKLSGRVDPEVRKVWKQGSTARGPAQELPDQDPGDYSYAPRSSGQTMAGPVSRAEVHEMNATLAKVRTTFHALAMENWSQQTVAQLLRSLRTRLLAALEQLEGGFVMPYDLRDWRYYVEDIESRVSRVEVGLRQYQRGGTALSDPARTWLQGGLIGQVPPSERYQRVVDWSDQVSSGLKQVAANAAKLSPYDPKWLPILVGSCREVFFEVGALIDIVVPGEMDAQETLLENWFPLQGYAEAFNKKFTPELRQMGEEKQELRGLLREAYLTTIPVGDEEHTEIWKNPSRQELVKNLSLSVRAFLAPHDAFVWASTASSLHNDVEDHLDVSGGIQIPPDAVPVNLLLGTRPHISVSSYVHHTKYYRNPELPAFLRSHPFIVKMGIAGAPISYSLSPYADENMDMDTEGEARFYESEGEQQERKATYELRSLLAEAYMAKPGDDPSDPDTYLALRHGVTDPEMRKAWQTPHPGVPPRPEEPSDVDSPSDALYRAKRFLSNGLKNFTSNRPGDVGQFFLDWYSWNRSGLYNFLDALPQGVVAGLTYFRDAVDTTDEILDDLRNYEGPLTFEQETEGQPAPAYDYHQRPRMHADNLWVTLQELRRTVEQVQRGNWSMLTRLCFAVRDLASGTITALQRSGARLGFYEDLVAIMRAWAQAGGMLSGYTPHKEEHKSSHALRAALLEAR